MPVEGMERQQYLDHKFGGKDNAKNVYDDIYKAGKEIGIYFQFDKITVTPNSFASHKLLALAYKFNKQTSDYFFSDEDNDNLLNEEKHAKELGIKGVPCFIINKKFVLYGAQTKENFINIFNSITDV